MRKGYRTADARLRSFENGLFCCKLTVASGIQNGLLHVSLGTVEKRCRGGFIKSFHFGIALHEQKKPPFPQNKNGSLRRKLI